MTPTATEVLDAAKALSRAERAEVTQELLATLSTADVSDQVRRTALQAAIDAGTASLDAGKGIHIASGGLREYLRERGRLAAERAANGNE